MKRRSMSTTRKARIFTQAGGVCHICGVKIQVGEPWEADHKIPLAMGGSDDDENIAPAHEKCHGAKTNKEDRPRIAKAKRVWAKHHGAWAGPKRKIPGSKGTGVKFKVGGGWERTDD